MKYSKTKIIQSIFIFLVIMLFFTIISNKVDYMMTSEVITTRIGKTDLKIDINTNATVINGYVSFNLSMEKESLLQVGDSVQAEFVNGKYKMEASVVEKTFNPEYQTMKYTCMLPEDRADVYEGQICKIQFDYLLGTFDMVLPRECVIYEGQNAFVYYIETVNTIIGEKHIAQKAEVNVIEEDDFYVAISSNINERHMVVQYFSKPIHVGSKVRMDI